MSALIKKKDVQSEIEETKKIFARHPQKKAIDDALDVLALRIATRPNHGQKRRASFGGKENG